MFGRISELNKQLKVVTFVVVYVEITTCTYTRQGVANVHCNCSLNNKVIHLIHDL